MSSLSGITSLFKKSRFAGEVSVAHPRRSRSRRFSKFVDLLPSLRSGQGSVAAVLFIASGWIFGAVSGGAGPAIMSGAAATIGLTATDIVISGQVETKEQDVFSALSNGAVLSLVGFDVSDARERVLALPWVRDVAIRKLYPGKLQVSLAEKRAMAVWQHKDRLTVVEKTGAQIAKFGIADLLNNRFSHLPHLVGEGAAESAREILPLAARYPEIAGRVETYVRVGDRRWDIQLSNGLLVKLPEKDAGSALERLILLEEESQLLEREISVVDLRHSDRVVFRLEAEAAKTRSELVSARLKAMKKADRKL